MWIPAVVNGFIELVVNAPLHFQIFLGMYVSLMFAIGLSLSLRVKDIPE